MAHTSYSSPMIEIVKLIKRSLLNSFLLNLQPLFLKKTKSLPISHRGQPHQEVCQDKAIVWIDRWEEH